MARSLIINVKNNVGQTLTVGKLVYFSGFDEEELAPEVGIADSGSLSTMPAVGMVKQEIAPGGTGPVQIHGLVGGFNTSSASVGDEVYVSTFGGVSFDPPMDEGTITQPIGIVVFSDTDDGQILLFSNRASQADVVLTDGSRQFNSTIKGMTPTLRSHLSTKGYVDDEILDTKEHVRINYLAATNGTKDYIGIWSDRNSLYKDSNIYWDSGNSILQITGSIAVSAYKSNTHVFTNSSGTTQISINASGQVSVGTALPTTSCVLDVNSTTGAFMPPRMTTTQRDALTAANGMIIYNTTVSSFQGYAGGIWVNL